MPPTLFKWRRDAESITVVVHSELATVIDFDIAGIVFCFYEKQMTSSIDKQVVDLCHLIVHHDSQVMQQGMVFTILESLIQVMR